MLAVVTNRDDLTADYLILELERRGAEFIRLNTEDYPTAMRLRWTLEESELQFADARVRADEISAVWWRRPVQPAVPTDRTPAEAAWAQAEAKVAWDGFWSSVTGARWVNERAANVSAGCKPEQLLRAVKCGFSVPATLLSADPAEVRAFASSHGPIVCKALYDGRVPDRRGRLRLLPTVELDAAAVAELRDLGPEPAFFQERVEKVFDIRVTVIGERAYACRIDSQEHPEARVDWRRGDVNRLRHEPIQLSRAVAARCAALTRSYGLRFAAIDLAQTPNGNTVFFELNPNGQWAWVEQMTGLPLAARIADELLGG